MQADTNFPMVRRMFLFHAPLILMLLPLFLPPETDPQILERWGCADEVHLDNFCPSEGFWSRILIWRAIAFVNFTRWIGFCMSELFCKIDDNFGGSMSWNERRNPIVVYSMNCTQQVRDLTHDGCHGLQRVAPFYHAAHASSTWLLHFCHHSF